MNETEVKKMLTAAQAYIVYLEEKELTLLEKTHELACEVDDLKDANDMLVKSNEDLARKLQYFKECNDNQARLIIKLHKEEHAY
jgi:hypothetical protein